MYQAQNYRDAYWDLRSLSDSMQDHIHQLQLENAKLKEENERLKIQLSEVQR